MMLSFTGMPRPGGKRQAGVPRPTSEDPTACLRARAAEVGAKGVAVEVHSPIPLEMRNRVSTTTSRPAVHTPVPCRRRKAAGPDRGPPVGSPDPRWAQANSTPTATSPVATPMTAQWKPVRLSGFR